MCINYNVQLYSQLDDLYFNLTPSKQAKQKQNVLLPRLRGISDVRESVDIFFSPYVTRRTSYVALPSRVRLHEAKGAFFESHPVSRAAYAVAIDAPPRPVVILSLSLFPSFVRTLARSLGRSEVVGRSRATSRRTSQRRFTAISIS